MNKIKGVIFDLDHTLFNRYATFEALQDVFYNSLKEYLSEKVTPRDMYIALKNGDKQFLYYGWDEIARYVFGLGYFKTPITEKQFNDTILTCFMEKAVPYDFTIPTLYSLKKSGYKVGLITNGKSELQRKKLSMLNLENIFDEIIVGGEFGKNKPDLSIFHEMSRRLNIKEKELMYVGDHPVNDVDAASKAGYVTVWVKSNGTWIEGCNKPDFEVDSVKEILSIFGLAN